MMMTNNQFAVGTQPIPQNNLWLPEFISTRPPGIYKFVKKGKDWELVYDIDRFKLSDKIYGKVNKYTKHIWGSYNLRGRIMSVLATGLKGSGKTLLAMLLCNKAIDAGMYVVQVTEVNPDSKLLGILASLDNVVILLDEFGKTFNYQLQQQALTMLTAQDGKKKLFLLTDNETSGVNSFMLNRPGRIRYHIKFDRLEEEVVIEYCKDKQIDSKFVTTLLERYKKASSFTYDHLEALVEEHINYPEMDMDELLEIMNISIISKVKAYRVIDAIDEEGNVFVINPMYIDRDVEVKPYGKPPKTFMGVSGVDKKGEPIKQDIMFKLFPVTLTKSTSFVYGKVIELHTDKLTIRLEEAVIDPEELTKKHPYPTKNPDGTDIVVPSQFSNSKPHGLLFDRN